MTANAKQNLVVYGLLRSKHTVFFYFNFACPQDVAHTLVHPQSFHGCSLTTHF